MLGRYVDLGNPMAAHPHNAGRVCWLYGLPNPYTGGAYWRDLTPKRNHGTLTGAVTWCPVDQGTGIAITPTGAKRISTAATVAGAAGFTVSGTFKASTFGTGGFGYNVLFGFTTPSYHFLAVNSSRNFSIWGAGSNFGSFPNDGGWHRIVWTHLAGSDAVYVDGVLAGTTTSVHSDTAPLYVGNRSDADQAWDGRIADVSVWARRLSASDVAADYVESRHGYPRSLSRWDRGKQLLGGSYTSPPPPPPPGQPYYYTLLAGNGGRF